MARSEIAYAVQRVNPLNSQVAAVNNANVEVRYRAGGLATVYQFETGSPTFPNPLSTDAAGRVEGWLEPGKYELHISGPGITTPYIQPINVVDPIGGPPSTIRLDSNLPIGIPDGVTNVEIPFVCNQNGLVHNVEVNFYVTHANVGDLEVELESPDGSVVTLINNRGTTGDNFGSGTEDGKRMVFADDGTTNASALTSAEAPFIGRFRPEEPLSTFFEENIHGTWILRFIDTTATNVGSVQKATLFIGPHYAPFLGSQYDIADQGTILPWRPLLDFLGAGVTVTADGDSLNATIPGKAVEDEGTPVTYRDTLNFVGNGVTVTDSGGKTTVTISAPNAITIQDEGTPLTQRTTINFTGSGVAASDDGTKTVVTVNSGVAVQEDGSAEGAFGTLNFTSGIDATPSGGGVINIALEAPEAWQDGTSAINASFTEDATLVAEYRRDRGNVYARGKLTATAATATIFTLPVGYRPTRDTRVWLEVNAVLVGATIVAATGVVTLSAAPSIGHVVYLDNLKFGL